jgi:hypothetical protein
MILNLICSIDDHLNEIQILEVRKNAKIMNISKSIIKRLTKIY